MYRISFDEKPQGIDVYPVFNFLGLLAAGETISTAVVTATVYSGDDPAPPAPTNEIQGSIVTATVVGGVVGVTYLIECGINTSFNHQQYMSGFLSVIDSMTMIDPV